jgi:hypothetical protein
MTLRTPPRTLAAALACAAVLGLTACSAAATGGAEPAPSTAAPSTAGPATAAPATAAPATDPSSCDPADPGLGVLQSWVPRSDVDGDGAVSREEFVADADASLRTWDVDRDGDLAGAEVERVRDESAGLLAAEEARDDYLCGDTDPPQRAAPPSGAADAGAVGPPDLVAAVDADGDGVLTGAEWAAGTEQRFGAIDCDGDAVLSTAEAFAFGRLEGCPPA